MAPHQGSGLLGVYYRGQHKLREVTDLRVTSENDPGSRFLSPVNSVAPMLSPAVLGVSSPRELRPPPHSEIDEYGPVRVGGGAVQGARTRARDKLVRALLLRRAVC